MGNLLFLHAQTALHAGSGAATAAADLAIQRERHTMWPMIQGASVKGVLRDACRLKSAQGNGGDLKAADNSDDIVAAFGPPAASGSSSDNAGAIAVTDARLALFPVRSLKGVFAWVTCASAIERLARDAALAGVVSLPDGITGLNANNGSAVTAPDCPCIIDGTSLLLEEFDFKAAQDASGALAALGKWFADNALPDGKEYKGLRDRLVNSIVVLSDDDYSHFVRYATIIETHIALDYKTKTVKDGALFYQEFLPPECLLYSVLLFNDSRRKGVGKTADDFRAMLQGVAHGAVIQIGGNETTGKGFCRARIV